MLGFWGGVGLCWGFCGFISFRGFGVFVFQVVGLCLVLPFWLDVSLVGCYDFLGGFLRCCVFFFVDFDFLFM